MLVLVDGVPTASESRKPSQLPTGRAFDGSAPAAYTSRVRVIRYERQKDNLAKFCWDMAKIALGALVIAPIAKPEGVVPSLVIAGVVATAAFGVVAYFIDGRELRA